MILKMKHCSNEVRSTFNLWSTLLAETRKVSRERASLAEAMASEMVARLDIMTKDVHMLTKKVKKKLKYLFVLRVFVIIISFFLVSS